MSDIYSLQDEVPFEIRLAETIVWCQQHVRAEDPRWSLRRFESMPAILSGDRIQMVRSVLWSKRSGTDTNKFPLKPVTKPAQLAGGKLLAYFPDENLSDGAAEVASDGFFDVYNTPAWDTWTGLFEDLRGVYLVAWIPPEFVELVNGGIAVNPEKCIEWLSDTDVALGRTLKSKGLLV